MLWWVREWSRLSSPSQLWVAGSLSSYDVIISLFCTKLLIYSKDMTFVFVPWFIISVRLGPSTPGDYVCARVLVPRNLGVTCAHWQQPAPTVELVVEGYKYPQPPPLQPSKHSSHSIQYKSKTQHSKTQIKATDLIKVPNSILVFRTCERIVLVFLCCSCCLVGFLLPRSCSLSDL